MPQARTLMRTAPGPGSGIGRSTISNGPFGRETCTTRMVAMTVSLLTEVDEPVAARLVPADQFAVARDGGLGGVVGALDRQDHVARGGVKQPHVLIRPRGDDAVAIRRERQAGDILGERSGDEQRVALRDVE